MLHKAKTSKKFSRLRRGRKTRAIIAKSARPRLHVHRTPQHIRATVYSSDASGSTRVLASASSLEKALREEKGTKSEKAAVVGKLLAERAVAAGVSVVAFDRGGFKYHGRVKALADAARASGLEF